MGRIKQLTTFDKTENIFPITKAEAVYFNDTRSLLSILSFNLITNFDFVPFPQIFIAPINGEYKIQCWGAAGGSDSGKLGGKGGYTEGIITLSARNILYIYTGGQGPHNHTTTNIGGWNGGGYSGNNNGQFSCGGGGATDIRLFGGDWQNFDSLKSRIMVAAGGGGAVGAVTNGQGGGGGGLTGISGVRDGSYNIPTGGTQIAGGVNSQALPGYFGYAYQALHGGWGGGGGSGYWGGAQGYGASGAGGSSYISGHNGCNSLDPASVAGTIIMTGSSTHMSRKVFTNTVMIDGNNSMTAPDGTTEIGHDGNGYCRITLIK